MEAVVIVITGEFVLCLVGHLFAVAELFVVAVDFLVEDFEEWMMDWRLNPSEGTVAWR